MFKGPWQQTVTQLVILITPLLWIAWDFYSFYTAGNPATESATLYRWAYYEPGIAFLVGLLCGHIFFTMREPIDWPVNHDKTPKENDDLPLTINRDTPK